MPISYDNSYYTTNASPTIVLYDLMKLISWEKFQSGEEYFFIND